jgi:hypothetical protein
MLRAVKDELVRQQIMGAETNGPICEHWRTLQASLEASIEKATS